MEIAIIGAVQAIAVVIISGFFARNKKLLDKMEHRAILRAEESKLSMRFLSANLNVSREIVHALQCKKTNGSMDAAMSEAEDIQREYFELINNIAARTMNDVSKEFKK